MSTTTQQPVKSAFRAIMVLPLDDLIEIAVLMNNIKRQYKQLNNG